MMTMKEWDQERMAQYFDTTDLWKLVNDSTHAKEPKPQIQKILVPETKYKWNKKAECTRRVLPILRKHFSRR